MRSITAAVYNDRRYITYDPIAGGFIGLIGVPYQASEHDARGFSDTA